MWVAFTVRAVFTEPLVGKQSLKFSKDVKKNQHPFSQISAVGGTDKWIFDGVVKMRRFKHKKRIAYEITALVVKKVEELTRVGVDSVDFDKISPEYIPENE